MQTSLLSQWEELIKNTMSNSIPNEIVIDILSRLPVKSLLGFRSASKNWCTLFTDPKLMELHIYRAVANHADFLLVRHVSDLREKIHPKWDPATVEVIRETELPVQSKGAST